MPTLCAGLDWLEPEEFPAWRRRLELERRAHNLTLHRQKALGTLLAFWGAEGLFPRRGRGGTCGRLRAHCAVRTGGRAGVGPADLAADQEARGGALEAGAEQIQRGDPGRAGLLRRTGWPTKASK